MLSPGSDPPPPPTSARIKVNQKSPGLMSPSRPLKMHEGDSKLDLLSKSVERCHIGTSLTKVIAGMSLMNRYEEEDGSDSDASAEIDEVDKDDEEEMHFKSRCEKCKAAQQSPEYEKVTPRKISKWSFQVQLEGEGTYECSATGLVFEVSEQALVRYSVLSWFKFAEFLKDSWRPAGSIYDVDVVNKDSSVLKFIHFPHSLCLAEPEHELSFSVLHVKGSQADIESTVDFTASHVKWRVSSLSPGGLIIPSSRQGTHHGAVLVYKEGNHKYFFQVYLGVNSSSEFKAIEEQVNKSRKKCIKIYKPTNCNSQLVAGKNYHLTSEPEGKVEPSEQNFNTDKIGQKGFSEARFDEHPPFRLFLMDSVNKKRKNCDKPLWSATITEEDLNSVEPNIGQKGLVQNRCKPVKKKSSCSSGQGSFPGELSPSPPPKMPKSNDTLDTNRGQALTSKQLLQVAETLGQEWGRAGIYLGLSTTDLDVIMAEKTDVTMQKLKMLERWQRRTPGEATAQDLLRGLQDLKDLPVETRQLLRGMVNGSLTLPDHKANA
ncbi:unnamed protein product [Gadus morhua 'NCC']